MAWGPQQVLLSADWPTVVEERLLVPAQGRWVGFSFETFATDIANIAVATVGYTGPGAVGSSRSECAGF
ncbi:protein of unknown function (plasmid) [Nitratireductor aquimarinus]